MQCLTGRAYSGARKTFVSARIGQSYLKAYFAYKLARPRRDRDETFVTTGEIETRPRHLQFESRDHLETEIRVTIPGKYIEL